MRVLDDIKARMRKSGLRVTPQRLAVMQVLVSTDRHPNAEDVYKELKRKFPDMSRATVYSALRSLQQAGLIQEIGSFGDIRRFDGTPTPHVHAICVRCNKIVDVGEFDNKNVDFIQSLVCKQTEFQPLSCAVSFYGYCPDCSKKTKKRIHQPIERGRSI